MPCTRLSHRFSDEANRGFDVLRLDSNGNETGRQTLASTITQPPAGYPYALTIWNHHLFIAENDAPHLDNHFTRDDFGYVLVCAVGETARIIKLSTDALQVELENSIPNTHIYGFQAISDNVLYAGSEHNGCDYASELAVAGWLNSDLKPTLIWKDASPFNGYLVSIIPTGHGYVAVGNVSELISVREPKSNADELLVRCQPRLALSIRNFKLLLFQKPGLFGCDLTAKY